MSAATARVPAHGWILADFDDTLAPDDSHAGLLRFILRRRIWPLLLWPLMAFGAVIYLLPGQRSRGIALIWWAITLGLSPWPGAPWYGSTA
jgi:phosphatidylglycerophosphatase C